VTGRKEGRKEGRIVLVGLARSAYSSVCAPSGEGAAMCLTDAEVCSVSKVDKEACGESQTAGSQAVCLYSPLRCRTALVATDGAKHHPDSLSVCVKRKSAQPNSALHSSVRNLRAPGLQAVARHPGQPAQHRLDPITTNHIKRPVSIIQHPTKDGGWYAHATLRQTDRAGCPQIYKTWLMQ
jgi:hypothetical protein